MDKTITLRPDDVEILTWYWSWGTPIGPASDMNGTVIKLRNVMLARVF